MRYSTRNVPATSGGIEFAIGLAALTWRLAECHRLFHSSELATELENKTEGEVRAILKERFKHIL